METYNIAVVGASGAVGEELFRVLEEVNFPVGNMLPLASAKSAGETIEFKGKEYKIEELTEEVFEGRNIDIAFFSAGGSISAHYAKYAVEAGAVVIDNTSNFRMDPKIPLVVPEVNPEDIALWKETGIIANPNCSTIQMVQLLKPLHDLYGIKRVDVSTYQAVSGAGKKGMEELVRQMQAFFNFTLDDAKVEAFAHRIALNVIPHIDVPQENGYTKEEMKMVNETRKIFSDDSIQVTATTVRVPVMGGHSESVNLEFEKEFDLENVRQLLSDMPGVIVQDDVANNLYPMPRYAEGKDEVFVGRIRRDESQPNSLNMWIVSDNLRKGAATNAIQIAESMINKGLLGQ